MAEPTTNMTARSDIVTTVARAQDLLRETLASGNVPVAEEINLRAESAKSLLRLSEQLQQQQYLYDAIDHLETILRRVPTDSPDRAKHLNTLSYAKMSQYIMLDSRHALDQAVFFGRQARDISSTSEASDTRSALHLKILNNLGYALSHRYGLAQNLNDIDEAIACARNICSATPKSSAMYQMTLNNFASRLRLRYVQSNDQKDIDEAMKLINELLSLTTPGTPQHVMALGQLGMMAADKFKKTDKMEDLDEGLTKCKMGLEGLPTGHETTNQILRQIVELLNAKHIKTNSASDLKTLVDYSGQLFQTIPEGHARRGQYLLDYLQHLQKYTFARESIPAFDTIISLVQEIFKSLPKSYSQKQQCHSILANIYGKKYIQSKNLQDLITLIDYTRTTLYSFNDQMEQRGASQPSAGTMWLSDLKSPLIKLVNAPIENAMRNIAERDLPEAFRSYYKSYGTALKGLEQLYQSHCVRLQVWAEAIERRRAFSQDEFEVEEARIKNEKAAQLAKTQRTPEYRTPEYETECGLRKLAIDPQSKNIVFDLSGMMESKLGYDPTKPVSSAEFIARETRMEQDAINAAWRKGRKANVNLCRMCRDLSKPLRPTTEGFVLTAKEHWLPFGNFFQLRHRKNCVVCRLIFSIITDEFGSLHPRLSAMDREIQGTRLSTGILSTGETVMRIDYGMRHVGELRILCEMNYHRALRQAWEIDTRLPLSKILSGDHNNPIYNQHDQQVNLALVKSWLNDCDHNHGSLCNSPRPGVRAGKDIPITLVDVVANCLVKATSRERYFALSYVWGRVELSKTLKSNYDQRQQPGGLVEAAFPRTIQDAIRFVRSLGEKYLWIDAICLIQDNADQMSEDIPNMDLVYGHAFTTIIALHGNDANAGLPGVVPGTRACQYIETLTVSNQSPDLDYDPESTNNKTISLVATPSPLYLALEISKWNSRGWIVQERLLSRRCLYFSSNSVYFQCARNTLNEIGVNAEFKARIFDTVNLDDEHILKTANRDNPLFDLKPIYELESEERLKEAFEIYKQLVGTYTIRDLSFKSDILDAFAGIFAVLDDHFRCATYHGLPAAIFSHALLWTPAARLPRRGSRLPSMSDLSPGQPDARFPSWSWAGWDGPVGYRLFEEVNGKIVLPTPTVRRYEVGGRSAPQIIDVNDGSDRQFTQQDPMDPTGDKSKNDIKLRANLPVSSHRNIGSKIEDQTILAKVIPDPDRGSSWIVLPPQPIESRDPPLEATLLRFTAPTLPVSAFQIKPQKEYISTQFNVHSQSPQAVRRICDKRGLHCGLWFEQAGYGYVGQYMSPEAEGKIQMVKISEYGNAYRPRKGPYRVEGEIRLFDDEAFPATGSGSGLVNVLVVDFDMGHPDGTGDRCTVAIIHAQAWRDAGPQENEIQIA